MKLVLWLLSGILSAALPVVALAQHYPDRPIRLVVPFATGGGTDFVARAAAPKMSEALGQPIVIDNRGGANGVIGTEIVARATPDGYTLLLGAAGTLVVAPHLSASLPFQTMRDFVPVSLLGISPFTGGAPHLATELFKSMAGVDMVHVPYKGLAPAVTDLLGGQIQVLFADVGLVLPHIRSGKVKALAVSSIKRSSALPDLPTIAEAGVPGYDAGTWYGLLAPAGTPAPIIARVSAEANKALRAPDIRERFAAQGTEPSANTPEEFRGHIETEFHKWQKVIQDAGIKLE